MMERVYRRCDELERETLDRIAAEYGAAAVAAVKDLGAFLEEWEALMAQKPPSSMSAARQERWRRREARKLLKKHTVESRVSSAIALAGALIIPELWKLETRVFQTVGKGVAEEINRQQRRFPPARRRPARFTQYQREIQIALRDEQPTLAKVAFGNLKRAPLLRLRLRSELAQSVRKGENPEQLVSRIRAVMKNGAYNARRIAQTERTRVQSQAAWEVMLQSQRDGLNIGKEWRARMVNTRDSHADLNGKRARLEEPFRTVWGNSLLYPGDPSAPAKEVVNCHCVLLPVVLLPGEEL